MDMEFKSLAELYTRLRPALLSKLDELYKLGMNYLKEEDIWNYLKEIKWSRGCNLSLADMVDDILNLEDYNVENYMKQKMSEVERNINLDKKNNLFNETLKNEE